MWLVAGFRHREIVLAADFCKPRNEIGGQERRIAGHGHDERMRRRLQAGVQSGERAGEAADLVAHHAMAERA